MGRGQKSLRNPVLKDFPPTLGVFLKNPFLFPFYESLYASSPDPHKPVLVYAVKKTMSLTWQVDSEVPVDGNKPVAYLRSLSDEQQKVGFRPALPTYYDPLAHTTVNDRIQQVNKN